MSTASVAHFLQITAIIVATGSLLSGCAAKQEPTAAAEVATQVEPEPEAAETPDPAASERLENHLTTGAVSIASAAGERTDRDLLKVAVVFSNESDDEIVVEVRTTFIDGQGDVLEETGWEQTTLAPAGTTPYTITSLSSQAADYKVAVRTAGD